MKKIMISMFFLLFTAMLVSAEADVTKKITTFPPSYAGYHTLNVKKLDVGVNRAPAEGQLGNANLTARPPLQVSTKSGSTLAPGQTFIHNQLFLENAEVVQGPQEVAFGDAPASSVVSNITFDKNLRVGTTAKLKNLYAENTMQVKTLKFNDQLFPACSAPQKEENGNNNMFWAKLRLASDPTNCAWHLTCGHVPAQNECDPNGTVSNKKTCIAWYQKDGKRCQNVDFNKGNSMLVTQYNTQVDEDEFDDVCCGKACQRWVSSDYTKPALACPSGFQYVLANNKKEVSRSSFVETCCSTAQKCDEWRNAGKVCPSGSVFYAWNSVALIEGANFTYNCCAGFQEFYWKYESINQFHDYNTAVVNWNDHHCDGQAVTDNCTMDYWSGKPVQEYTRDFSDILRMPQPSGTRDEKCDITTYNKVCCMSFTTQHGDFGGWTKSDTNHRCKGKYPYHVNE